MKVSLLGLFVASATAAVLRGIAVPVQDPASVSVNTRALAAATSDYLPLEARGLFDKKSKKGKERAKDPEPTLSESLNAKYALDPTPKNAEKVLLATRKYLGPKSTEEKRDAAVRFKEGGLHPDLLKYFRHDAFMDDPQNYRPI